MQKIKWIVLVVFVAGISLFCHSTVKQSKKTTPKVPDKITLSEPERQQKYKKAIDTAKSFKNWLSKNNYNTDYMFVVDFSISMDYKRFHLIDLNRDSIEKSSIVAHGRGGGSSLDVVKTSNKPGSLCSSVGRYKIGDSLWGEYGKGFWLHGLDTSNSNATKRLVVMHYYDNQSCEEGESPIYYSEGCPMMCKTDFYYYNKIIKNSSKPMLMLIYK